jgi:hypothetical protein
MLHLSILLPPLFPVALALTASPAFRIKTQAPGERKLLSAPKFFNYFLANSRGISAMEYAVVAGAAVSMAWVLFIALGVAFAETNGGTLA